MDQLQIQLESLRTTNVTKTTRNKLYPAVSPSRAELSQSGRVVLVTGGGQNIGFAIARAFVQASADTVIIIGRRAEVLEEGKSRLEEAAKIAGTSTKILSRPCDVTDASQVDEFWGGLKSKGINVDVLVANAAKFTEPVPLLELGADEVWSQVEMNLKSPLYFTQKFYSQGGEKQKFIVNVSTQAVHMTGHPGVAVRPGYTLSKMGGTLFFQLVAQNVQPERIQIINYHPGLIYNDVWKGMGLTPDLFDDDNLCGGFAVWATTKEAEFLHGRFVWAAWDVEELATGELRKRIDEDPYFLRASVVGLNGALLA